MASFPVEGLEEVIMVTNRGKLIRLPVKGIRIAGRVTQGVTLLNTEKSEKVVSVTTVKKMKWIKYEKKRTGLYPGSFDPVTNGHLDIIFRAHKLVDQLVIGVAKNHKKDNLFSMSKRKELILNEIKSKYNSKCFKVVVFDGLLMNFAKSINANLIVRGLRAVSDFDYEFQMTGMNARLNSEIETIFLMASEKHQFISSRFVKEIYFLNGQVKSFIPKKCFN